MEGSGHPDYFARLEAAETKLQDMKSNIATLGKEDASAMAAVEAHQQQMTLQRLISMLMQEHWSNKRGMRLPSFVLSMDMRCLLMNWLDGLVDFEHLREYMTHYRL